MEKQIIRCRIDVSKIDKKRIFSGEKGRWYDFAVIESPSKYNDFIIVEEISREERDAGNRGTIIGNGKLPGKRDERQSTNNEPF